MFNLLRCDLDAPPSEMPQSSTLRLGQLAKCTLLSVCLLLMLSGEPAAQTQTRNITPGGLAWTTDSTGPRRFISVHGRRAAVFGYPQENPEDGLEVWAYPVQILSSYNLTFRQQGAATGIDGGSLLRRIVYSPDAVTRVYAGPDFIVREKLFVPLDEPGAIIRYEVESAHPLDIVVRFVPVLDLMWPASMGGQDAVWDESASSYLLSELTHRFTASVGSPDIVAHDDTPNSGQRLGGAPGLAFTIRAGGKHKTAQVVIAEGGPGEQAAAIAKRLMETGASLEKAAVAHYSSLLDHSLQIETPDADTNRALAWSEIAIDQAWVCNPDLGCGIVAGYGPSRRARRPQYDWFFAGDGMVAIRALLASGQFERAREELEFILRYQDPKTGMIWHELSQSAGLLDWKSYPYMFVHVDLTFDFLNVVSEYFSASGDKQFVRAHWSSIQHAYEYCQSLLDPKDGLPRIPADKGAAREQDALGDELALSLSWAEAAQSYADLAAAVGQSAAADQAGKISQHTVPAIAQRYWDENRHSWISGYTRSGSPLIDHGAAPTSVRGRPLLSETQRNSALDQLAASDFQADWGTRGRASSSDTYSPNSYASGSVWATGTASAAATFWEEHRPATALPVWTALVPWSSLDSLGHLHEALAGDFYHEEVESVPEQTWSSALFLAAAVHGLIGLQIDGVKHRATFAPHLPANWNGITLRNVRVGGSAISIHMQQSAQGIQLQMRNDGAPVEIVFDPEIPLGARLRRAQLGNRSLPATLEQHSQDTHARMEFTLERGTTSLAMDFVGGVAILTDPPRLMVGDPSTAIKLTGVKLENRVYSVDLDYMPSSTNAFEVRTLWTIKNAQGATCEATLPDSYRCTVNPPMRTPEPQAYRHATVAITFAGERHDQ